ncbi:MAG: hypothetical protein U1D31_01455, partial [Patescibacteria group bacterium]|nr:hypothetical protein [bacterium]MDZ4240773.1 hypothetical protein [Patescibacteria group bacterium]
MDPIVFIYLVSLSLNVVTSGISGLFLFFSAWHNRAARSLAYCDFGWMFWSGSHFVAIVAPTEAVSVLAWQIGFFGLLAGCVFFADFAARLVEEHNKVSYRVFQRVIYTFTLTIAGILLSDLLFETNIILSSSVSPRLWFDQWLVPGRFLTAFIGFFLFCFSLAYVYFFLGYKQSKEKVFQQTILLLFWTTIVPAIGGSTQYLIWYDVPLLPLGGFTIPVYVFGVLYAATRFHLFNAKVITAELFTIIIWMITFGRILVARDSFEFTVSIGVFLLTLFFGLLTIRSVITEVKQKDSLEQVTKELDHANKNLADLNSNLE